jgi:hypothetical protein
MMLQKKQKSGRSKWGCQICLSGHDRVMEVAGMGRVMLAGTEQSVRPVRGLWPVLYNSISRRTRK